jgi:hypothetical protein
MRPLARPEYIDACYVGARSNVNIDEWFKKIRETYPAQMQCGKGGTACCHGLFDISLADAVDVTTGSQTLVSV